MAKLISKTYGEALFELAVEENKTDALSEEITALLKILDENPDLGKLMNHPKLTQEEKTAIIKEVFEGKIDKELMGFLTLVIEKDRYSEISNILSYFLDQVKEMNGIGVAYITTADELNPAQKSQIEEKLISTTSYKKMEMHYSMDTGLIGGMVIRIGDRVVDSSIRTKLSDLSRELLSIQMA